MSPSQLAAFTRDWKFHHPLSDEQLRLGDTVARVRKVGFYHGGDVLYELENIEGIWHEENVTHV